MELTGSWVATGADEGLRRVYPEPDFDDRSWVAVTVPGHWRTSAAFARHDGPLLYRHRFTGEPPAADRRAWLTFDGIFYEADAWLDGTYIGDTEGYFFPHTFEITDALRERREHVLAVEVSCARPTDLTAKRNLTGVFQHWDSADPDSNPGGLWRPVHVTETGPVRLSGVRLLCAEATAERAVLDLRAVLDSAVAVPGALHVTVAHGGRVVAEAKQDHALATGENRIRTNVVVENPTLWWPHALGAQPLHDVLIAVVVGGEVSDAVSRRTGLRQVRMKQWVATVNGERLFLKGTNQGPSSMLLGDAPPERLAGDVALARAAGLDLLRLHAHVSRPEVYDAADSEGVLIWQDLPLQWGYARTVRRQAVRQAREAVDLLGHHPSIALWCGHNEPLALAVEPGAVGTSPLRTAAKFAALQELPTWNKTILDGSIKRALQRADPTRPVIAHSGVFPHPGSGGTDSHWYFGWYHGDERDFPAMCAAVPRLARFVTEFGAQAVPDSAGFMHPERWPDLDWATLARTHGLQRDVFDRYVPPSEHETFDSWRAATQAYQARVIRFHIETLRRLKYRPTGGFCQFSFGDGQAGVTWSVLDHERVPKQGYDALAAACAPVIVVATRPATAYPPATAVQWEVHVVSDLRSPFNGVVTADVGWPGGTRHWEWRGDVPADDCVRVGTVRWQTPSEPGPVWLDLTLSGPALEVTNRYESSVLA